MRRPQPLHYDRGAPPEDDPRRSRVPAVALGFAISSAASLLVHAIWQPMAPFADAGLPVFMVAGYITWLAGLPLTIIALVEQRWRSKPTLMAFAILSVVFLLGCVLPIAANLRGFR